MKTFVAIGFVLWASAASAASVVWTCTLNSTMLVSGSGGINSSYLSTGECTSDTGTCDTSATAFTSTQICGVASRTIKDVIASTATVNGGASNGFAIAYDHANNRVICLGSNGAAAAVLAVNTATAFPNNSKFHFFSLCQ